MMPVLDSVERAAVVTVAMCVSENQLAGGHPIKVNQKESVRSQSRWML